MQMPEPDRAVLERRREIAAALKEIVPGEGVVYDPDELLPERINTGSVIYQRIETPHWEGVVRELVAEHVRETQSRFAERLLVDWTRERHKFRQVVPSEMVDRLAHPMRLEAAEQRA